MIGHAYLKLYPSRLFVYVKHLRTSNQPQPSLVQDVKLISTTIKKHSLLILSEIV